MPLQPIVRPMGHNPIPPRIYVNVTAEDRIRELEPELRHRRSRLRWRHRRAYAACLSLIACRQLVIDAMDGVSHIPEPGGLPPPDPSNRSTG